MTRLLVLLVMFAACSRTKASVAVLEKADGPMERQAGGSGGASAAPVGTKFYLGDVVRATTGGANLALVGGARIAMQPRTAVRFVAWRGLTGLDLAEGTLTLSATGKYSLALGDLSLDNGTVRITGGSRPTVELLLGRGELVNTDGQRTPLAAGKVLSLELGEGALATVADAGVPDAAPVAVDASVPDAVTIEVTGEGATIQAPGDTKWKKLALGTGTLALGTRVALDGNTTARLGVGGTTFELFPGARAIVTSAHEVVIDAGAAAAKVATGGGVSIGLPGGKVVPLAKAANTEMMIDVADRGDAKVTAVIGGAQLIGKRGSAELEIKQGESGFVRAAGSVAPGELVIPAYFDYALHVGDAAAITLHDPAGATAVRFDFASTCTEGGAVELDRSAAFRAPLVSVGETYAHLLVRAGSWTYRVRCTAGGTRGAAAASGRLAVVRDLGTRPLPRDPPRFEITADGRNYRLDYQSRIPDVRIGSTGKGASFKLHLESGGNDRVFTSTTGTFAVPGTSLRERGYTFWIERDGVKSKVSTLRIGFDQTAAQVYIESPVDGHAWGPQIEVAGATLPGWTATINGREISPDKDTRRFAALVPLPPEARAIAIQMAHPDRGAHVYLRRGAPK